MEPATPNPAAAPPHTPLPEAERGPFRVHHVRSGDRYELDRGHPVYCAPVGGDGSVTNLLGALVLASDAKVTQAGIDTGYALADDTLRAPDIAIGNVPDAPGWVAGAPLLAVEYASRSQNEEHLQRRIRDLLAAGTTQVWVVRLLGERHVEVHTRDNPMRLARPGETLTAPEALREPVPVEALFDPEAAWRESLKHLLQRKGYDSLDDVYKKGRDEGYGKGHDEGRTEGARLHARASLVRVLTKRGLTLSDAQRERVAACDDLATLETWLDRALDATRADDVFG
jgi:Uma2 family endonuclease